ncbi:AAA family ATPase [Bradyrhizobium erythrophlei]|uniref:ATP-binding protein n=1 Tax=Bradyrhizobium erythrophlei TaxID=1437360 RepID=UPI0035EA7FF1
MTETTTVTVLFTDVVGSTSLRQHHGDTGAHEIMNAHNDIVREQLGVCAGREIKTSGDSFMAAFESARKAVDCAIGIQRALHDYNQRHPIQPVKVRIGLHTGEAIRAGDDLFGTSVDAAARIMAKADAEQILVSDVVRTVLGAAKDVGFRDHKRVRLKGFPERWRLWEVTWRHHTGGASFVDARPSLEYSGGRTPYVGRSEERLLLRLAMDRTMGGAGGVVLIAGEAGIGKTRLVDEIAVEARARDMFVVRGHCSDMEGAPPYLPFVEAIEYGLAVTARDVFQEAMGDAGPEIARFVPKVRLAYPDLPPQLSLPTDQARHYMFESVCDFFERAATIRPMLFALEDLHWADVSTTQLLESVARRAARTAFLVIGTYRDVDLSREDPFALGIEHLSRLPSVSRIALKQLNVDDVARMLRSLSGQDPPEQLVRLIYAETEGVPFFVEEVYRHLVEEHRLTDAGGRWLPQVEIGEIEVPETIRLVLGHRIDRIGETAQRVLTTAACIGRTFTFEFLTSVAGETEDDLLDALEQAERARLLVAEEGRRPRYVFAHEQIRQTLLGRLAFARRQRLHQRIADAIERLQAGNLDEHVSDLAYHLAQAGAHHRAAKYFQQAGRSAAAHLATPEALAYFARAAELAGAGPTRRAALRARGELLMGLFRGREAAADLELAMREAAEEGAAAEEMEALLRLGRAYYVVGLDHRPAIAQSLEALERARVLAVRLADRHGEARALIPTHWHADFDPNFRPQATANADRALAIARELSDDELEIDALRAVQRLGTLAARRGDIERIAAALERRGDLIALNEHLFQTMWAYWRAGCFRDCIATCDRGTALARRLGIPPVQYGTIKSFALVDLGRFDEAWQALDQEVADDDHPFGQAFQRLGRVFWYAGAGDFERVIRDVPRAFADAKELQRAWMIPWADGLLASAIVASFADGTDEAKVRAAIEAAGGQLVDEALVAARLLAGNPDGALAECARRLPRLEAEGLSRAYWLTEDLRIRALVAVGRYSEVCGAVEMALNVVAPAGWQSLAWRLHASLAVALERLGRGQANQARRAAIDLLMSIADTFHESSARSQFLSQRIAKDLISAKETSK